MKASVTALTILSSITSGLLLTFSNSASADQAATIRCVGQNVVLEERSPYLGEDSKFKQRLFILKAADVGAAEDKDTAYFLNIHEEGATGRTLISGKNGVKGHFELDISAWVDVGNGTVIKDEAKGSISYNHGTLSGTYEPVSCTRE